MDPDQAPSSARRPILFGPFRLIPSRQLLLDGDRPVRLGSRALDILIALAERPGEIVGKDDLIARVWPDTFVEEGNLRVHISALRRALGDGQDGGRYVATIPGRGYSFVAKVAEDDEPVAEVPTAAALPPDGPALPMPPQRLVGRADTVRSLAGQLRERRFITIVGPGGIGKTAVALAVAEALTGAYRDTIRFVDLAATNDPRLVPSALASALGLAILSEDPIPGLVAFLADREMLLVIDNCEQVIEAAARLTESICRGAPGVHILATSREPLRVEGERVLRLGPLELPPESTGLTAAEALRFPAVQLFAERAAAAADTFRLTDAEAPLVAEICRRLDGVALAIELAAGRVDVFGVRGVAERLDDRFRLLSQGRRTALPRQKTLAATTDWSYQLLPEPQRLVLMRMAIFAGAITLDSAAAIASDAAIAGPDVVDAVADLVAKSLVAAGGAVVTYRLLDTTRAFALERLVESGDFDRVARRHALYFRALFETAEAEAMTRPTPEWLADYGPEIGNLRAALDSSFSASGDRAIGIALTVAAVPLWMHLSLVEECHRRVATALAALAAESDPRHAMKLNAALGSVLVNQRGSGPDIVAAWTRALALAEQLDDTEYRLRALWGLWADQYFGGDVRAALAIVDRFRALAPKSADPGDVLVGDRIYAVALHSLGDQAAARRHIEPVVANYVTPASRSHMIRYQFDQGISARSTLSLILWLQGFSDAARLAVEDNVARALSIGHTLSLCSTLANAACPLSLNVGDLAAAERYVTMLLDQTHRHGISVWHAWGRCFEAVLMIKQGESARGIGALRNALAAFPDAGGFALRDSAFRTELAEALGRGGESGRALAAMDEAIARAERLDERWCFAEMLRVRGELILIGEPAVEIAAEDHFLRAIDWARRQEALAWELRAATSLARLRARQDRAHEGKALLAAVHQRFSEGLGTVDLRAAAELLAELG